MKPWSSMTSKRSVESPHSSGGDPPFQINYVNCTNQGTTARFKGVTLFHHQNFQLFFTHNFQSRHQTNGLESLEREDTINRTGSECRPSLSVLGYPCHVSLVEWSTFSTISCNAKRSIPKANARYVEWDRKVISWRRGTNRSFRRLPMTSAVLMNSTQTKQNHSL